MLKHFEADLTAILIANACKSNTPKKYNKRLYDIQKTNI